MYSSASVANKTCLPSTLDSPAILFEFAAKEIPLDRYLCSNAGTPSCVKMADKTEEICGEDYNTTAKVRLAKIHFDLLLWS